jgi:predicted RNase H-like HicB family nuclease
LVGFSVLPEPCAGTVCYKRVSYGHLAESANVSKVRALQYGYTMLTYKAMYKFLDQGVHAEVLDFPGTITFGENLQEARRLLASALVDMAETNLLRGEPLPQPDPSCTDPEADLEEPIYLLLVAAPHVRVVPESSPR